MDSSNKNSDTHHSKVRYIIIAVSGIFIIGGIILLIKTISGSSNNKQCPSGQTWDDKAATCYDNCTPGTTYYSGLGCFSCDPSDAACQVCSSDADCLNKGKCIQPLGNKYKGICRCKSPWMGKTCSDNCTSDGNECLNGGKCNSGTCMCKKGFSGLHCETQRPNCDDTNCNATGGKCNPNTGKCDCFADDSISGKGHWVDDPNNPNKSCTVCEEGWGPDPSYNCNRVLYPQDQVLIGNESSCTTCDGDCVAAFGNKSMKGAGNTYQCNNCDWCIEDNIMCHSDSAQIWGWKGISFPGCPGSSHDGFDLSTYEKNYGLVITNP